MVALYSRARRAFGRIPRAARVCALVAFLNAACWSFITPPFQNIDEPTHFAYTQQLAENLRLPTSDGQEFSPEETEVLLALHQYEIRGAPEVPAAYLPQAQKVIQRVLEAHLSRHGTGAVGGSASDPPLYYLLETIPYELASGGTLFDQLEAMRLLSALMGGLAALFAFLFVREALPAARWAWTVAGLSVAVMPLLGSMSGAVNPDSMLFAVSAAVFYCLARAFRAGLTRRLAVAIGTLTAVGLLTKVNFIGLAPGIVLGLIVLTVRASRTIGRRAAAISFAIAVTIAASPVLVYVLANALSNHSDLGIVSTTLQSGSGPGSLLDKLSYVWQLYLPPLPGMTHDFPGLSTTMLWFDRSVGFYGWLDTLFPPWVMTLALLPAGALGVLLIRGLAIARGRLPRRLPEIGVYAVISVGLLVLIGATSYLRKEVEGVGGFFEPRYLAPLLPLLAASIALAARGAGRRWGPAVGSLIVVLFLAHDIFSQLLVIGRFYG
jgi:4-amino-4-deoxy-L-arabinose transferase-like glycosyltransferase